MSKHDKHKKRHEKEKLPKNLELGTKSDKFFMRLIRGKGGKGLNKELAKEILQLRQENTESGRITTEIYEILNRERERIMAYANADPAEVCIVTEDFEIIGINNHFREHYGDKFTHCFNTHGSNDTPCWNLPGHEKGCCPIQNVISMMRESVVERLGRSEMKDSQIHKHGDDYFEVSAIEVSGAVFGVNKRVFIHRALKITERVKEMERLERAGAALDKALIGTFNLGENYTIQEPISDHMATMLGAEKGALIGRNIGEFLDSRSFRQLQHSKNGEYDFEITLIKNKGTEEQKEISCKITFRVEGGNIEGSTITIADISEQKERERTLIYQASHDDMTGLLNKAAFEATLPNEIEKAKREGVSVALLMIDLNDFKKMNDIEGHEFGDITIQFASEIVKECSRENIDIGVRRSGDELYLFLYNVKDLDSLKLILNRIREKFRNPIVGKGKSGHIAASIGVSFVQGLGRESNTAEIVHTLLEQSDATMYESKKFSKYVTGGTKKAIETISAIYRDTSSPLNYAKDEFEQIAHNELDRFLRMEATKDGTTRDDICAKLAEIGIITCEELAKGIAKIAFKYAQEFNSAGTSNHERIKEFEKETFYYAASQATTYEIHNGGEYVQKDNARELEQTKETLRIAEQEKLEFAQILINTLITQQINIEIIKEQIEGIFRKYGRTDDEIGLLMGMLKFEPTS